jgi:hypothetical protein
VSNVSVSALVASAWCSLSKSNVLSSAVIERFTRTSSGALEPLVEGSTRPVVILTHAGFTTVERSMPSRHRPIELLLPKPN